MSYFEQAFAITMKNEGGYNNIAADKGGETYKGVARVYFPNWAGWKIIDQIKADRAKAGKPVKNEEIFNNSQLDALVKSFYLTEKWNGKKLEQITNLGNAALLFDMSTQHGYWARIANAALQGKPVNSWTSLGAMSGSLTADTINAVNSKPQESYNKIAAARKVYVDFLVSDGQLAQSLYKGVLDRANKYIKNVWGFVWSPAGKVMSVLAIATVFF